jgi:hypothetical protein
MSLTLADKPFLSVKKGSSPFCLSDFVPNSVPPCLRYSGARSAIYHSMPRGTSSAMKKPKDTRKRPANRFKASRAFYVDANSVEITTYHDTSRMMDVWEYKALSCSQSILPTNENTMPTVRQFRSSVCEQPALRADTL